jgi:hypothetical protein
LRCWLALIARNFELKRERYVKPILRAGGGV